MDPRHADVAFVLESVGGVREIHAIRPGRKGAEHFDFAVQTETEHRGRTLAEVYCALLRVMTHEEVARVYIFHLSPPNVIAEAAQLLRLDPADREAARARVASRPPPAEVPAVPAAEVPEPTVLIVRDDVDIVSIVREAVDAPARVLVARDVDDARRLTAKRSFDVILCDRPLAFGPSGLLASLPLEIATRVLVMVWPTELADARWRLQGTARIITKPLEAWVIRQSILRAGVVSPLLSRDLERAAAEEVPRRRLTTPPSDAPFTVLLADVTDELHDPLRAIFREEARHVMKSDPSEAAETALSSPFHVVICSMKAALHPRSVLDGIAREDPAGADRVIVVAPARDVPYVHHKLGQMMRKNTVLALPIDETALRREVFDAHPTLAARVAVADAAKLATDTTDTFGAKLAALPRFRRLAVLVVDDNPTTQILFAAAEPRTDADVTLASTTMEAFEHVTSRHVDVLVVSATMRGDGGEPFYRVLWRLSPELKGRSVLVMASDAVPPSAVNSSKALRILERPLTQDALGRVVEAFGRR
jgi:CheY-like chemotaxis protein